MQNDIPDIIPDTAAQFLVYGTIYCGKISVATTILSDIEIYVTIDGKNLAQHLFVIGYDQDAYNTNSDNMWFPMPSNRKIYVDIKRPIGGDCKYKLVATGYC